MGDNMKEYIKKYWLYAVIGLIVIGSLALYRDPVDPINPSSNQLDIDEVEPSLSEFIYVDIKGEVVNPGVYKLSRNSRLFQVVNLAGGLSHEANPLLVNLSKVLHDEDMIYIPSIYDVIADIDDPTNIVEDNRININEASIDLLVTLSGIGPVTAEAIVDYRENIQLFVVIEDILEVPGIGEATFEAIKDFIKT